jgi:hypothetical protein
MRHRPMGASGRRDRFVLCTKYEVPRDRADPNAAGKVLHLGLSDTPPWVAAQAATLAHCHGWGPANTPAPDGAWDSNRLMTTPASGERRTG